MSNSTLEALEMLKLLALKNAATGAKMLEIAEEMKKDFKRWHAEAQEKVNQLS